MRREKDLKIVGAASAAQKFGGLKPALQVAGIRIGMQDIPTSDV